MRQALSRPTPAVWTAGRLFLSESHRDDDQLVRGGLPLRSCRRRWWLDLQVHVDRSSPHGHVWNATGAALNVCPAVWIIRQSIAQQGQVRRPDEGHWSAVGRRPPSGKERLRSRAIFGELAVVLGDIFFSHKKQKPDVNQTKNRIVYL